MLISNRIIVLKFHSQQKKIMGQNSTKEAVIFHYLLALIQKKQILRAKIAHTDHQKV